MPPGGLHIRWPDAPLEQEARLMDYKWYGPWRTSAPTSSTTTSSKAKQDRFWHHCQRQGLQRHAPGPGGSGPSMTTPAAAWASACTRSTWCGRWKPPSPATLRRACKRFWWWRKSARSSNTSSGKSCTTGAPMCAPTCWASSTRCRATTRAANGACPTPARTGCCAPRPT